MIWKKEEVMIRDSSKGLITCQRRPNPEQLRHKQKIEDKKLLGRGLVKDVAKSSSLASLLAVAEV